MAGTLNLLPATNTCISFSVDSQDIAKGLCRTTFIGNSFNCKGVPLIIHTSKSLGRRRHVQASADSDSESDDAKLKSERKEKVKTKKKGDAKFRAFIEDKETATDKIEMKESDMNQSIAAGNGIKDSKTAILSLKGNDDLKASNQDLQLLLCLLERLEAIKLHSLALERWNAPRLLKCQSKYNASARNLLHYVAFRSIDIYDLQDALSSIGLANLQGIEAHTMSSLMSVYDTVRLLLKAAFPNSIEATNEIKEDESQFLKNESGIALKDSALDISSYMTVTKSKEILLENVTNLFGPRSLGRMKYIMVTVPMEAGDDEALVLELMKNGMNIARINCAHGKPELWKKMIKNIRNCSQQLEQPCRVLMDLAGPKLRTGPFQGGPCVLKIKPHKDVYGKVLAPSQVWISSPEVPSPSDKSPDAILPVAGKKWLETLCVGDVLKFTDTRGKQRELKVTERLMGFEGIGYWAECESTAYVESGTEFELLKKRGRAGKGKVLTLPCTEKTVRVRIGDIIEIIRDPSLNISSDLKHNNDTRIPIQVTCSFGQLFDSVKPGEPIMFDDGKIEGIICGVTLSKISVEVTFANEKGTKLGGENSINVPQSNISFKGLTVKDLIDLDFIATYADMVALSFVNDVEDVELLQDALLRKGAKNLGIILKIETRSGFEKLPLLLLQGMETEHPLGVMIARGDLAVECGWDSMVRMQDQLLQICEAAHVPTIWATQVLERLTKSGMPTRAELTDAAAGARAECIMLNKGPYITKAVAALHGILQQLPTQPIKVRTMFHPLQLSSLFQT